MKKCLRYVHNIAKYMNVNSMIRLYIQEGQINLFLKLVRKEE
jgi:hypothetical protein